MELEIGDVVEIGPYSFLVLKGVGGYIARIRRSDWKSFRFRGNEIVGVTTRLTSSSNAARTEAIHMIGEFETLHHAEATVSEL